MLNRDELKEELLQTDANFRRLHDEHQDYERRLHDLQAKPAPSVEDEADEKRIKLHKLALKDQMEAILRTHQESRVSA